MRRLTLSLLSLFAISCQNPDHLKTGIWSVNSKKKQPKEFEKGFQEAAAPIKLGNELVGHSVQKLGAAIVDGAYLQKIYLPSGEAKYLKSIYQENLPEDLVTHSIQMDIKKYQALEIIRLKYPPLDQAQKIFIPRVIVNLEGSTPRLVYEIEYIDKAGKGVYQLRVNNRFSIEKIKRVEMCFQSSKSLVFPNGPKFSQLAEEILHNLLGDGSLTSNKFNIESADGQKVLDEGGNFQVSPEDVRFDQIQAFFFVQKALDYAEKQWNLSLPFQVKVQLRTGFPEKSNTAFYFRGNIRLGDGDGIRYQNIPRDPSIVTHETMHAIIDAISGLSPEEDAGAFNEGFADFLAASIWDNPNLGHTAYLKAPYKRTVDNPKAYVEKDGITYHDGDIVSGTFWEIRKSLGGEKTQMLALRTIARLGAKPLLSDLRAAVLDSMVSSNFSPDDSKAVVTVLDHRGWP